MGLTYPVYRLLLQKGESLTLRKLGNRTYTPGTGPTTPTNTDYTVTAKLIEFSDYAKAKGLAQEGSKKVLISALGLAVAPNINDLIIKSSVSYSISDVQTLTEGSTVVAYVCVVKS